MLNVKYTVKNLTFSCMIAPYNIEMAKCQYCSYLSFIYTQIYWVKFDIPRKGKLMSPNIQCLERELRLRLRPADLIWLLLYHFPHQQITRAWPATATIMNILYRHWHKKHRIIILSRNLLIKGIFLRRKRSIFMLANYH